MATEHAAPSIHTHFTAEELAALDSIVTREGKFDHHPTDAQKAVAAKIHELATRHPVKG